jgi:hypothetical protein
MGRTCVGCLSVPARSVCLSVPARSRHTNSLEHSPRLGLRCGLALRLLHLPNPSPAPKPTRYVKVGLPYGYFTSLDPLGSWVGPVLMSPDGEAAAEAQLLLFATVSSNDLSNEHFDGSDNSFSIIVAVRDKQAPLSVPRNGTCFERRRWVWGCQVSGSLVVSGQS